MTVGFIILAHQDVEHVARLARHLCEQNAPVVVHLDTQSAGKFRDLRDMLPREVDLISTRRSEWGRMGLVEATLDAAGALISSYSELTHVYLLCGATLPLRPVEDLRRFLTRHSKTDFIEAAQPDHWITGGLGEERFTLFHPFSWKRRRWFFDRSVELQRRLGVRRSAPAGLVPRLGRQWWCVRAKTLKKITNHPNLGDWKRFFQTVWIPDESFFQTIVASIADESQRDGRGLTLTRFDESGNPITFHDDHCRALETSEHFFVRKVDRDAGRLRDWAYARPSLGDRWDLAWEPDSESSSNRPEHSGMQMAGRFPRGTGVMRPDTASPYLVIIGTDRRRLSELRQRLQMFRPDWEVHGHIFGQDAADFSAGGPIYRGNLPARSGLRDYRPEQYLRNLIWVDRDRFVVFLLAFDDNQRALDMILADQNALMFAVEPGDDHRLTVKSALARIQFLQSETTNSVSDTIGEIVAFAEQDAE